MVFDFMNAKYGFSDYYAEQNVKLIEGVLEHVLKYKKPKNGEYRLSAVEVDLRRKITESWFDGKLSGLPSKAALKRKASRIIVVGDTVGMKGGAHRPSLVDTGLLRKSITVRAII